MLFDTDDGSLPDIFVENLSDKQIIEIYSWIRSISSVYGDPTLWNIKEKQDISIKQIKNPAYLFTIGEVEMFRHGLADLIIDGVEIPSLTISVEKEMVSFDYRMGNEWSTQTLEALFKLLKKIKDIAPNATIIQADEGSYDKPNNKFTEALSNYLIS